MKRSPWMVLGADVCDVCGEVATVQYGIAVGESFNTGVDMTGYCGTHDPRRIKGVKYITIAVTVDEWDTAMSAFHKGLPWGSPPLTIASQPVMSMTAEHGPVLHFTLEDKSDVTLLLVG